MVRRTTTGDKRRQKLRNAVLLANADDMANLCAGERVGVKADLVAAVDLHIAKRGSDPGQIRPASVSDRGNVRNLAVLAGDGERLSGAVVASGYLHGLDTLGYLQRSPQAIVHFLQDGSREGADDF
jgi:hypothetical protein